MYAMLERVFGAHPDEYASYLRGFRRQFRDFLGASTVRTTAPGSDGTGPSL